MSLVPLVVSLLLEVSSQAAVGDPLAEARAACDSGDFERVLELVAQAKGAPPRDVADVLARAAQVALDQGDRGMAALYCEQGLGKVPAHRQALEVCVRAALADFRWEDATRWGAELGRQLPHDPAIALLRAQAALGDEEWGRAKALLAPHARGVQASQVAPLLAQAEARLLEAKQEQAQQKELEQKLAQALADVRALDRAAAVRPAAVRRADEVVLYSTSWCGPCKRAKEWLKKKGIDFTERDVEKDRGATQELAEKCARAGVRPGGVPVLDARGRLLTGFDEKAYAEALQ